MKLNTKFDLWQTVYIYHDPEQHPRVIDIIKILPGGVSYRLCYGTQSSEHYEQELSVQPNNVKKFTES